MLTIHQFTYSSDNLGYIIFSKSEAVVVDGGDPDYVGAFLSGNNLRLLFITNTHSHFDHTMGNQGLKGGTGAEIISPGELSEMKKIFLEEDFIEIIDTPGHTKDSICLQCGGGLITGDTLFIANVGNCPPERLKMFRKSLDTILNLPDDTVTYSGHDYTERSIKRSRSVEPSNKAIDTFYRQYSPPPITSTIGAEKNINPYLRAHKPEIVRHLMANGKPADTPFACFQSFMELY